MAIQATIDIAQAFLDCLTQVGLCTQKEIDELCQHAMETEEPVAEALIVGGRLTRDQCERFVKALTELPLICHYCAHRTVLAHEEYQGILTCPNCAEQVSLEEGTAGFGEALVIDHPRRIKDQILGRLLVTAGLLVNEKFKASLAEAHRCFPRRPLEGYLIEEGDLSGEELHPFLRRCQKILHEKIPFIDQLIADVDLARFLVGLRFVSVNEVNQALNLQAKKGHEHEYLNLRTILLESGVLTPHQVESYLPKYFDDQETREEILAQNPLGLAPWQEESTITESVADDDSLLMIDLGESGEEGEETPTKKKDDRYPKELKPGDILNAYMKRTYGS